ncbi:MAG TPA: STM4014 family protein [Micromonospora sp.]|nr:STM4014 family protein [Micromonospora sp.]
MTVVAPLVVVGNPGNRRVSGFCAAAARFGLTTAVLPWRRLATGPVRLPRSTLVRIDSPGEDNEVDRLLRGAAIPARHGEIIGMAAWYRGMCAALRRLTAAAAAADATLLNDPDDVATFFDKGACHRRLSRGGVPVPPALLVQPGDYGDLRAAMRSAGWSRVFVKPTHGSSASGVLALQVGRGRVQATTSVELTDNGLFNSLRVRSYRSESEVATIVDRLAPDGLHVERWFPKVGIGGRTVDLRVLVVAGEPTHVVVRASRSPLTNLHLGNQRGDLAALRAAMEPARYAAALDTCVRAAACFPASLHVGVDLLIGTDFRRHVVAEVNAFGDLLPGLRDAAGRDSYETELHALRSGRFAAQRVTGLAGVSSSERSGAPAPGVRPAALRPGWAA